MTSIEKTCLCETDSSHTSSESHPINGTAFYSPTPAGVPKIFYDPNSGQNELPTKDTAGSCIGGSFLQKVMDNAKNLLTSSKVKKEIDVLCDVQVQNDIINVQDLPLSNTCACKIDFQSQPKGKSLISIPSDKLEYMKTITDLATKEKQMKNQIECLKSREQTYKEVLKNFENRLEAKVKYDSPSINTNQLNIQDELTKISQDLKLENQMLKNELMEMKLELKHTLERIEGPMLERLETEKCKCAQLEKELQHQNENLVMSQDNYAREMNSLKMQLCMACTNMTDMNAMNARLKNELKNLDCMCSKLEEDLVRQKVNEAETLKLLSKRVRSDNTPVESSIKQPSFNNYSPPQTVEAVDPRVCTCSFQVQTGSNTPFKCDDDLHQIARKLSQTLRESEPCGKCANLPAELKGAAKCIKDLTDMVVKHKGPPSLRIGSTQSKSVKDSLVQSLPVTEEGSCQCSATMDTGTENVSKTETLYKKEPLNAKESSRMGMYSSCDPCTQLVSSTSYRTATEPSKLTAFTAMSREQCSPCKSDALVGPSEITDSSHLIKEVEPASMHTSMASEAIHSEEVIQTGDYQTETPEYKAKKCDCDFDVKPEQIENPPEDLQVTTVIQALGSLEVITEGASGLIETSLTYKDDGNIEVLTKLTEYNDNNQGHSFDAPRDTEQPVSTENQNISKEIPLTKEKGLSEPPRFDLGEPNPQMQVVEDVETQPSIITNTNDLNSLQPSVINESTPKTLTVSSPKVMPPIITEPSVLDSTKDIIPTNSGVQNKEPEKEAFDDSIKKMSLTLKDSGISKTSSDKSLKETVSPNVSSPIAITEQSSAATSKDSAIISKMSSQVSKPETHQIISPKTSATIEIEPLITSSKDSNVISKIPPDIAEPQTSKSSINVTTLKNSVETAKRSSEVLKAEQPQLTTPNISLADSSIVPKTKTSKISGGSLNESLSVPSKTSKPISPTQSKTIDEKKNSENKLTKDSLQDINIGDSPNIQILDVHTKPTSSGTDRPYLPCTCDEEDAQQIVHQCGPQCIGASGVLPPSEPKVILKIPSELLARIDNIKQCCCQSSIDENSSPAMLNQLPSNILNKLQNLETCACEPLIKSTSFSKEQQDQIHKKILELLEQYKQCFCMEEAGKQIKAEIPSSVLQKLQEMQNCTCTSHEADTEKPTNELEKIQRIPSDLLEKLCNLERCVCKPDCKEDGDKISQNILDHINQKKECACPSTINKIDSKTPEQVVDEAKASFIAKSILNEVQENIIKQEGIYKDNSTLPSTSSKVKDAIFNKDDQDNTEESHLNEITDIKGTDDSVDDKMGKSFDKVTDNEQQIINKTDSLKNLCDIFTQTDIGQNFCNQCECETVQNIVKYSSTEANFNKEQQKIEIGKDKSVQKIETKDAQSEASTLSGEKSISAEVRELIEVTIETATKVEVGNQTSDQPETKQVPGKCLEKHCQQLFGKNENIDNQETANQTDDMHEEKEKSKIIQFPIKCSKHTCNLPSTIIKKEHTKHPEVANQTEGDVPKDIQEKETSTVDAVEPDEEFHSAKASIQNLSKIDEKYDVVQSSGEGEIVDKIKNIEKVPIKSHPEGCVCTGCECCKCIPNKPVITSSQIKETKSLEKNMFRFRSCQCPRPISRKRRARPMICECVDCKCTICDPKVLQKRKLAEAKKPLLHESEIVIKKTDLTEGLGSACTCSQSLANILDHGIPADQNKNKEDKTVDKISFSKSKATQPEDKKSSKIETRTGNISGIKKGPLSFERTPSMPKIISNPENCVCSKCSCGQSIYKTFGKARPCTCPCTTCTCNGNIKEVGNKPGITPIKNERKIGDNKLEKTSIKGDKRNCINCRTRGSTSFERTASMPKTISNPDNCICDKCNCGESIYRHFAKPKPFPSCTCTTCTCSGANSIRNIESKGRGYMNNTHPSSCECVDCLCIPKTIQEIAQMKEVPITNTKMHIYQVHTIKCGCVNKINAEKYKEEKSKIPISTSNTSANRNRPAEQPKSKTTCCCAECGCDACPVHKIKTDSSCTCSICSCSKSDLVNDRDKPIQEKPSTCTCQICSCSDDVKPAHDEDCYCEECVCPPDDEENKEKDKQPVIPTSKVEHDKDCTCQECTCPLGDKPYKRKQQSESKQSEEAKQESSKKEHDKDCTCQECTCPLGDKPYKRKNQPTKPSEEEKPSAPSQKEHDKDCTCEECTCPLGDKPYKRSKQPPAEGSQKEEPLKKVHDKDCTCEECTCPLGDKPYKRKKQSSGEQPTTIKEEDHYENCTCAECTCLGDEPVQQAEDEECTCEECPFEDGLKKTKLKKSDEECTCDVCPVRTKGDKFTDRPRNETTQTDKSNFGGHPMPCNCSQCICEDCTVKTVATETTTTTETATEQLCDCPSICECDNCPDPMRNKGTSTTVIIPCSCKTNCICETCGDPTMNKKTAQTATIQTASTQSPTSGNIASGGDNKICKCAPTCENPACEDPRIKEKHTQMESKDPDCICAVCLCGDNAESTLQTSADSSFVPCDCKPICTCPNCADPNIAKSAPAVGKPIAVPCDCTPSCTCPKCADPNVTPTGQSAVLPCDCSPTCTCITCADPKINAMSSDKPTTAVPCDCTPVCNCIICADPSKQKGYVPCDCKPICQCIDCADKSKGRLISEAAQAQTTTAQAAVHAQDCICSECKCDPNIAGTSAGQTGGGKGLSAATSKKASATACTCFECICVDCDMKKKPNPNLVSVPEVETSKEGVGDTKLSTEATHYPGCTCVQCFCSPCGDQNQFTSQLTSQVTPGQPTSSSPTALDQSVIGQSSLHPDNCSCVACKCFNCPFKSGATTESPTIQSVPVSAAVPSKQESPSSDVHENCTCLTCKCFTCPFKPSKDVSNKITADQKEAPMAVEGVICTCIDCGCPSCALKAKGTKDTPNTQNMSAPTTSNIPHDSNCTCQQCLCVECYKLKRKLSHPANCTCEQCTCTKCEQVKDSQQITNIQSKALPRQIAEPISYNQNQVLNDRTIPGSPHPAECSCPECMCVICVSKSIKKPKEPDDGPITINLSKKILPKSQSSPAKVEGVKMEHPEKCTCNECVCEPSTTVRKNVLTEPNLNAATVPLSETVRHGPECSCKECVCTPCVINLPQMIQSTPPPASEKIASEKGHPADCLCNECLCNPCKPRLIPLAATLVTSTSSPPVQTADGPKSVDHPKGCRCSECICDPCKAVGTEHVSRTDGHLPDCICDQCVCSPCKTVAPTPTAKTTSNQKPFSHPADCHCKHCLCDPCKAANTSTQPISTLQTDPTSAQPILTAQPKLAEVNNIFSCTCSPCKCKDCPFRASNNGVKSPFSKDRSLDTNQNLNTSPTSGRSGGNHRVNCTCDKCICPPTLNKNATPANESLNKSSPEPNIVVNNLQTEQGCTCTPCKCKSCPFRVSQSPTTEELEGQSNIVKSESKSGDHVNCTCNECSCLPWTSDKETTQANIQTSFVTEKVSHGKMCSCDVCKCENRTISAQDSKTIPMQKTASADCTCEPCLCINCYSLKREKQHSLNCTCPNCTCTECQMKKDKSVNVVDSKPSEHTKCNCVKCLCADCYLLKKEQSHAADCVCENCTCKFCRTKKSTKKDSKLPTSQSEQSVYCSCSTVTISRREVKSQEEYRSVQKPDNGISCNCTDCKCVTSKVRQNPPLVKDKAAAISLANPEHKIHEAPFFEIPKRMDCNCTKCQCYNCKKISKSSPNIPPQNHTGDSYRNLDDDTLKQHIATEGIESTKCRGEIDQIMKALSNIKSACNEAESKAYMPGKKDHSCQLSFNKTMSSLQNALSCLQEKCRKKDMMIMKMTEELQLRNTFYTGEEETQEIKDSKIVLSTRSIQTKSSKESRGERQRKQRKLCKCSSKISKTDPSINEKIDLSGFEIMDIRRITVDSLIVKWNPPKSRHIVGYDIFVNGVNVSKILSGDRSNAMLHKLDLSATVQITIYAVTKNGRCEPPAIAIYEI